MDLLDKNLDRLRWVDQIQMGRITTLTSNRGQVERTVADADLVIGAVLVPGGRAPVVVSDDMVRSMKPGAVIVDIAVDQGGCVETTHETTHQDPVYETHGVVHYAVGNMPGAVPHTSTYALTNVTLPYLVALARGPLADAISADPALALGVNTAEESDGEPGSCRGVRPERSGCSCGSGRAVIVGPSKSPPTRPVTLDSIDKAIIRELQLDGRRPYAQLGPNVGLSQAAVRQRVQRLIDSGFMQVVAVTDPQMLGFTLQAMVGVRASGDLRNIARELAAVEEIDYVVITSGSFDLLLEVVCTGQCRAPGPARQAGAQYRRGVFGRGVHLSAPRETDLLLGHPLSSPRSEVRRLASGDRREWMPLWEAYLEFYAHELPASTTESTWERLVGDDKSIRGLCVADAGTLVGICHLVFHPSTWSETSYCYLEDLFVRPDQRSSGLGRALISAAATEARSAGSSKMYWQTQETNSTARHLYDDVATNEGSIIYGIDL